MRTFLGEFPSFLENYVKLELTLGSLSYSFAPFSYEAFSVPIGSKYVM